MQEQQQPSRFQTLHSSQLRSTLHDHEDDQTNRVDQFEEEQSPVVSSPSYLEDDPTITRNNRESPESIHATNQESNEYTEKARNLVRTFTDPSSGNPSTSAQAGTQTQGKEESQTYDGTNTPDADTGLPDVDYVPTPRHYKPSVFGALLKSRTAETQLSADTVIRERDSSNADTIAANGISGKGLYDQLRYIKSAAKDILPGAKVNSSNASTNSSYDDLIAEDTVDLEKAENQLHNTGSQDRATGQEEVVAEVADILAHRHLIIKLCESFMKYGAPTHRLEDYLKSAARALEIDAIFMYMPGTMTCTFRDQTLQTNTVELIRGREGLDFARLKDAFDVYKRVIHEPTNASERKMELDSIENRPDEYTVWFRILMFGISSVIVGPFSFDARPIDFIPVLFLGCALGFLQLKVVPRSEHFSNVFEVSAAVVVAFAARGLGSIKWYGNYLFCFSAVAQSGIALILPGFMILNSALELQGQSMVAGSVRMVYAVIYVLFLGFGLLIGMTLYGLMDRNAVTETTCRMPTWFEAKGAKLLYTNFVWVPLFASSLAIVYRARWSQLPVMAFISVCGYQAYYWMSQVVMGGPGIANAIGALTIGCIANIYSRVFKGPAATNMLPAIYCLVPGGLATSGSLVAGVQSSEDIVNSTGNSDSSYSNTVFSVGSNAIQICIGTSVGLYLSALVVYPYGKRRSGLFSFS